MKIIKSIILITVLLGLNLSLNAQPDVSFTDSADFEGAYLAHVFVGDDMRFEIRKGDGSIGAIPDVVLPANSYHLDALINFVNNDYPFANAALARDFRLMFEESFATDFKAKPYLDEFVRLLGMFAELYPQHIH